MLVLATGFAIQPRVRSFNVTAQNGVVAPVGDDNAFRAGNLLSPVGQDVIPTGFALQVPAGEKLTISWDVWVPFGTVTIEPIGQMETTTGSIEVDAVDTVDYKLIVTSPLGRVLPTVGTLTVQNKVVVAPSPPVVEITAEKTTAIIDEEVVISWKVINADEVTLYVNDSSETIPPEAYEIGRSFKIREATTFRLVATNRYTSADGVQKSVVVEAIPAPPEPLAPPVLKSFTVTPLNIRAGETVKLNWEVENATHVTIKPIGDLKPVGSLDQRPTENTEYVLTATNGDTTITELRQVIVDPLPTPTPQPGQPVINSFTASKSPVIVGETVELKWDVGINGEGTVTNVHIEGGDVNVDGLEAQGTLSVKIDARSLFAITASNGSLNSSSTVEVIANNPLPVLSSISPSTSTAIGASSLPVTLKGNNFQSTSTVSYNGSKVAASFISSSEMVAIIPAAQLTVASEGEFKVQNAVPGGGESGGAGFTLTNPSPSLSNITPNEIQIGTASANVFLSGANFVTGAVVNWNGTERPAILLSPNQLEVILTADDLAATAGSDCTSTTDTNQKRCISVQVKNPAPGGGTSGSKTLTLTGVNLQPEISEICTADNSGNELVCSSAVTSGSSTTYRLQEKIDTTDTDKKLIIKGTNFVQGVTTFLMSGQEMTVEAVSATQATVSLSSTYNDNYSILKFIATNKSPGGGTSTNDVEILIDNPDYDIALLVSSNSTLYAGQAADAQISVMPGTAGLNLACNSGTPQPTPLPALTLHWQSAAVNAPVKTYSFDSCTTAEAIYTVPNTELLEAGTYIAWVTQGSVTSQRHTINVEKFNLRVSTVPLGSAADCATNTSYADATTPIASWVSNTNLITAGDSFTLYVDIEQDQSAVREITVNVVQSDEMTITSGGGTLSTYKVQSVNGTCIPVQVKAIVPSNETLEITFEAEVPFTANTAVKRTIQTRMVANGPAYQVGSLKIIDTNAGRSNREIGERNPLIVGETGYQFELKGSYLLDTTQTKVVCPNTNSGNPIYAVLDSIETADAAADPVVQKVTGVLPANCFSNVTAASTYTDLPKLTLENVGQTNTATVSDGVYRVLIPEIEAVDVHYPQNQTSYPQVTPLPYSVPVTPDGAYYQRNLTTNSDDGFISFPRSGSEANMFMRVTYKAGEDVLLREFLESDVGKTSFSLTCEASSATVTKADPVLNVSENKTIRYDTNQMSAVLPAACINVTKDTVFWTLTPIVGSVSYELAKTPVSIKGGLEQVVTSTAFQDNSGNTVGGILIENGDETGSFKVQLTGTDFSQDTAKNFKIECPNTSAGSATNIVFSNPVGTANLYNQVTAQLPANCITAPNQVLKVTQDTYGVPHTVDTPAIPVAYKFTVTSITVTESGGQSSGSILIQPGVSVAQGILTPPGTAIQKVKHKAKITGTFLSGSDNLTITCPNSSDTVTITPNTGLPQQINGQTVADYYTEIEVELPENCIANKSSQLTLTRTVSSLTQTEQSGVIPAQFLFAVTHIQAKNNSGTAMQGVLVGTGSESDVFRLTISGANFGESDADFKLYCPASGAEITSKTLTGQDASSGLYSTIDVTLPPQCVSEASPNLKIEQSTGGSTKYSDVTAVPIRRKQLVNKIVGKEGTDTLWAIPLGLAETRGFQMEITGYGLDNLVAICPNNANLQSAVTVSTNPNSLLEQTAGFTMPPQCITAVDDKLTLQKYTEYTSITPEVYTYNPLVVTKSTLDTNSGADQFTITGLGLYEGRMSILCPKNIEDYSRTYPSNISFTIAAGGFFSSDVNYSKNFGDLSTTYETDGDSTDERSVYQSWISDIDDCYSSVSNWDDSAAPDASIRQKYGPNQYYSVSFTMGCQDNSRPHCWRYYP